MNFARLNLQADVFAAVMSGLQGEENALDTLAQERATKSLAPIHGRRAEDYPFVIAMESAKYAFEEILAAKSPRKYMRHARQLALEIGHAFDDKSIRNWWRFSEPAPGLWHGVTSPPIKF